MTYGSDSDHHSERSYHSDSEYTQDEGVAGLALVSTNSYDIFDSPNEGIGRCFMAKGPKVTHPEYVDFNSDEDDLLVGVGAGYPFTNMSLMSSFCVAP